ncbi:hypothetical protein [Demequina sp. NBRC 110055]|uniref:hypothetical protein n=1 Tax=Demequina sp. NBRC 110055 TaxID=1570344 RepID=UPI0009FE127F|nr:hypothetical protein [Demequina sp. NBRC 110055]
MPRTPAALPADAVLVHIGPHKTGTTAIQMILGQSRKLLEEHGVLYPGGRGKWHHHDEAKALRGFTDGWSGDADARADESHWLAVVEAVRAHPGRVVISSEYFAQADQTSRLRLLNDLGEDRVHVIFGTRNPVAIGLSTWQQGMRMGYAGALDEWLERTYRRDVGGSVNKFWSQADPAELAATWSQEVAPERVVALVIDEKDRLLLPATFEQLLDLPAGSLASQKPRQSNRSLTAVEAELLRRVIATVRPHVSWAEFSRIIRGGTTLRLLQSRTPLPGEAKTVLPPWALEQAALVAGHSIARLEASDHVIAGRLESLADIPAPAESPGSFSEVPIDLAVEMVAGAIGVATRGHWSFDEKRRPKRERGAPVVSAPAPAKPAEKRALPAARVKPLDEYRTGELLRYSARRVRVSAATRAGRIVGRLSKR